jgi:hypothetical protein
VTTKVHKAKRVTIKIHRRTFDALKVMRKDTGAPITTLMALAVDRYAYTRPDTKRTRIRKLRGSR